MDSVSEARFAFIKLVIRNVIHGTTKSVKKLLQQGPPGLIKDPQEVEIQKWFLTLKENDRQKVLEIVQSSILGDLHDLLLKEIKK